MTDFGDASSAAWTLGSVVCRFRVWGSGIRGNYKQLWVILAYCLGFVLEFRF